MNKSEHDKCKLSGGLINGFLYVFFFFVFDEDTNHCEYNEYQRFGEPGEHWEVRNVGWIT